jgi:teichuronic acid biosynthesis glycosyltransferase TuaC
MPQQPPIRTLLFSTLYPSSVRPGHGIFVETRLRELLNSGRVQTKVIAPVPWFFSTSPRYGDYARVTRTPARELYNGVDVLHPRYFLPPIVGMNIAPFLLALGARPAVQHLLKEGFDFDVIDAHYYYPDGVAAALLARHFNKPFVVTARGSDINLISNYSVPRKLMRWASHRAYASIGVSQAITQAMANIGMPQTRLMMMPNGVDIDRFHLQPQPDARAKLGWPAQPTLLSVGNLVENKGHHIAIETLRHLPDFRLVIAGEGPEHNALQLLAIQLDVANRVQFMGRVAQDQLATCYCAADILVLASSREGWPNVLLESMACGTPVVATNVGGVPEIITSANAGRLMPTPDADDAVQSIQDLWRNLPSRKAVQARALGSSWQSTTDQQINLFDRIVAGASEVSTHA